MRVCCGAVSGELSITHKKQTKTIKNKEWYRPINVRLIMSKLVSKIHRGSSHLLMILQVMGKSTNSSHPLCVGLCRWSTGPCVSSLQMTTSPPWLAVATTPRAEHWLTARMSDLWTPLDFHDMSALTRKSYRYSICTDVNITILKLFLNSGITYREYVFLKKCDLAILC